ncbi:MAG: hypothetical protein A4S16_13085 [Proteobacteria bacterium SG_bin6]|nr:MAG: hypothetical protein A4S16_13085 [Proteobacteria bacterium SG_bin6]
MRRLALLACLALAACGLRPLYGDGARGPVGAALAQVEVAPIAGQAGYLVSNAVRDQLGQASPSSPAYRLEVKLDDRIVGLGVRRDDTVTRERRVLRARYQLIDLANGQVVLDATAGSDAGIDVVGSEYATIAAENTQLERLSKTVADQIVARVALYANRQQQRRP